MNNPILARVVETEKPKRDRLWVSLVEDSVAYAGWKASVVYDHLPTFKPRSNEILICIPGSDEQLTRERIEAAIRATIAWYEQTPGTVPEDAMRELVRRLGLESEGTA